MSFFPNIKEFLELVDWINSIVKSDANWDTKYDIVFSDHGSKKIYALIGEFEYYDPDTTYEEDVMAFVTAMNYRAEEYRKALKGIPQDDDKES